MTKWVSVRHIPLREGEHVEIDSDERVIDVDWEHPMFHLIVVKESNRQPKGYETNRVP
jgi:hypothetical protein